MCFSKQATSFSYTTLRDLYSKQTDRLSAVRFNIIFKYLVGEYSAWRAHKIFLYIGCCRIVALSSATSSEHCRKKRSQIIVRYYSKLPAGTQGNYRLLSVMSAPWPRFKTSKRNTAIRSSPRWKNEDENYHDVVCSTTSKKQIFLSRFKSGTPR
jgi:hypothetical protein